jgi:hypothetical protein|tara:strand:+ start:140 stop:820 length:681 start_codon:yes stop_codon:yes gene_type:complete
MNDSSIIIKELISFLTDVFRGKEIERQEPDFFKKTDELNELLHKYYISFKNNGELREQVAYNYNLIKDMSFPESKGDHIYVKDLSNHSKPNYSNEQYNSYALFVHSYLMRDFEERLKKVNNLKNVITDYENPYPEYFNSYGYEIYKDFTSTIKKEIVLAEMSFLVDQLKKDGLMNTDKTLISIFNFMIKEFDTNFGTATKFKSHHTPEVHLPIYKEIKKRYVCVSK